MRTDYNQTRDEFVKESTTVEKDILSLLPGILTFVCAMYFLVIAIIVFWKFFLCLGLAFFVFWSCWNTYNTFIKN